MSHAPPEAEPWKAQLLAGQIDLNLGEHAGRVLAQIHQTSAYYLLEFWPRFCDLTVFEQLRIAPFYRTIQKRNPDLAADIGSIIEQMLTVKEALCHGDYTPKNLLVHDSRFTLVDYETAHFGDPTMDIGLFLAHILLKAVRLPARRHDYLRLTDAFWRGYGQDLAPYHRGEAEKRGIRHLAVCLLARVDGTSPVDYLRSKAQRETVRWLGRSLLEWQVCFWHDVQTLFEQGVSPLAEDMP
jgi:5-methylthioribose kinase